MKILVTGSNGFIGVMMGTYLRDHGHEVSGIDTGFYTDGWLYDGVTPIEHAIRKDIRTMEASDLAGFDAVVHLAELSNDPLGKLKPTITYEINHKGSVRLAEMCKQAGVKRFVYASSCSVYGLGSDDYKTEESPVNPLTAYAECKVMVEGDVSALADDDFTPTFLRNATAYGASPRIRFDVVVNNLSGMAWTQKKIALTSDGKPWRPLVHVLDICQAFLRVLEAPREVVHKQIFNVGDTHENYRVVEIARLVADTFPGCELTIGVSDQDDRSYRVSFDKIQRILPDFACQWTAQKGAQELYQRFEQIAMDADTFEFRAFTRLKQLQHLITTNQIDDHFYWV
jgi:nucleoside-diphosphate-sugar epimerase